jgi:hypothetical protein
VYRLSNLAAFRFTRQNNERELEIWKLKMGFRRLPGLRKIGVHQGVPDDTNVYLQGFGDGVQGQEVRVVLGESG